MSVASPDSRLELLVLEQELLQRSSSFGADTEALADQAEKINLWFISKVLVNSVSTLLHQCLHLLFSDFDCTYFKSENNAFLVK